MQRDLRFAVLLMSAFLALSLGFARWSTPALVAARDIAPEPLDLNRASAEELAGLPVLGLERARRIVAARRARGGFTSIDELVDVPGVGAKTLERLRPFVVVGVPR